MEKPEEKMFLYLMENFPNNPEIVLATMGAYSLPDFEIFKNCATAKPEYVNEISDGILCIPPDGLTVKQKKIRAYVAQNF